MHSCLKILMIALFALSQAVSGSLPALAQSGEQGQAGTSSWLQSAQYYPVQNQSGLRHTQSGGSIDVEPPLIEHDVIAEAEADIRQSFIATVVDDGELDSVLFYYRYAGETSFSRYAMMPISYSSTYIAQIPTDPDSYTAIEYYIQARDASGNRTVRGYTFSPLVRNIIPAASPVADAEGSAATIQGAADTKTAATIPKALYILGGVLLLGLIASAAGSSGGGSDSGTGGACGADGCRLSLTVNQPF